MWSFSNRTLCCFLVLCTLLLVMPAQAQQPVIWDIHDMERPRPEVVTPGTSPTMGMQPPADAVVLFDGTGLDAWETHDGNPAGWKIEDGYMEVVAGTGSIRTKEAFGDVQLHLEWASPAVVEGEGQGRGNSGVFFMGRYEVQVLDSYQNDTYPDGQAAALYGQYPPLVNATRPPGAWQTYDIIFRRPHFDAEGNLIKPARVTVFHNGIVVQDNRELLGPTSHKQRTPYQMHPGALPFGLQDHGNPVRFRNIWIRPL